MIIEFVVLVILLFFLTANFLYKETNDYKNNIWQVSKFKKVPDGIEIAAVGSGPGLYDISFDGISRKGFNFCLSPQSFEYSYKILEQYQKKLEAKCIVIIVVCPLSFAKNSSYQNKGYYDPYYYFLNQSKITNYSRVKKIFLDYPILRHPRKILKIVKDVPLQHNLENSMSIDEQTMKKSSDRGIKAWMEQTNLKDLKNAGQAAEHEETFKEKRGYIEKILELCDENLWKPVFVIPPMSKEIQKQVGKEFQSIFVTKQLNLANKSKAPILDFFRDNTFTQNKYYKECFFLNANGRKLFSRKLFEDIEKIIREDK